MKIYSGGTVIGGDVAAVEIAGLTVQFEAPVIEVRLGHKNGPLLAEIDTATGYLRTFGDRDEGASL